MRRDPWFFLPFVIICVGYEVARRDAFSSSKCGRTGHLADLTWLDHSIWSCDVLLFSFMFKVTAFKIAERPNRSKINKAVLRSSVGTCHTASACPPAVCARNMTQMTQSAIKVGCQLDDLLLWAPQFHAYQWISCTWHYASCTCKTWIKYQIWQYKDIKYHAPHIITHHTMTYHHDIMMISLDHSQRKAALRTLPASMPFSGTAMSTYTCTASSQKNGKGKNATKSKMIRDWFAVACWIIGK